MKTTTSHLQFLMLRILTREEYIFLRDGRSGERSIDSFECHSNRDELPKKTAKPLKKERTATIEEVRGFAYLLPAYNLYESIGLKTGASEEEVKDRLKIIFLALHPDKNPDYEDHKTEFDYISYVKRVLNEHKSRYDTLLQSPYFPHGGVLLIRKDMDCYLAHRSSRYFPEGNSCSSWLRHVEGSKIIDKKITKKSSSLSIQKQFTSNHNINVASTSDTAITDDDLAAFLGKWN